MKKSLIAIALLGAIGIAQAADVGVDVGRDFKNKTDVVGVSVGTNVLGFGVAGEVARAANDDFNVYGVQASKGFTFGRVNVGPVVGLERIDSHVSSIKSTNAATVGLGASVAITQTISITAAADRRYDLVAGEGQNGNEVTIGLSTKF